jgi:1-acyl-sn-glycerol-3-phosphate acyltransferase
MKGVERPRGPLRSVRGARSRRTALAAAASPIPAASLLRHEAFGQRLRDLDRAVERRLLESGGEAVVAGSPLGDALELALDAWAEIARSIESGAPWRRLAGRGEVRGPERDDLGYDRAGEGTVAPLLRALYRAWWRVDLAGLERVPDTGRVLLVANHSGGLFPYDGAMLKVALREHHPAGRALRPLVDDFVYDLPLAGAFIARCGGVRASPENAEQLLRREQAVVVFPEGTNGIGKRYRDRYRLARFGRGGFVRTALRAQAPIVPVAVIGGEEIHPVLGTWEALARLLGLPYFPLTPTFPWLGPLGLVPLPSKWRIEFGEPIDWRGVHGPEAARDRLLVGRLRKEVRDRVQQLVRDALARRGPAFL